MSDQIPEQLARVRELATATPPELVAEARRRTPQPNKPSHRIRNAITGLFAAAVVGFAFTAPGRAATDWIAELAGFGEEPTLQQLGSVPESAVVIASGELSDGVPYEVVAKKVLFGRGPETRRGPADNRPAYLCFQVDFPNSTRNGQGGHCTEGSENGVGIGNESTSLYQQPSPSNGSVLDERGPGVFGGLVEIEQAASVKVFTLTDDATTEIPSQLIDIDRSLQERIGTDIHAGFLVTPLDRETVEAGRDGQLEVRAIAYDDAGEEIGHSDHEFCPPGMPPPPEEGEPMEPRRLTPAEFETMTREQESC